MPSTAPNVAHDVPDETAPEAPSADDPSHRSGLRQDRTDGAAAEVGR